jgi:apolipoprotein N-acyltransferase
MPTVSVESESPSAGSRTVVSDPPHVPARGVGGWLRDLPVVATLAAVTAVPWIDQRFVPLTWLVLAAPLAAVGRLRGWRGETLVLAWFATTLGIAFHWAPAVITESLDTSPAFGLGMAVVMVLWDAARWSTPFWFIGRTVRNPLVAWLPAGLVAAVTEWLVPGIFPWKIGYTQIGWPATVQAADLFGPEFTTFVAFAHAGAVVWLWHAAAAFFRPAAESPAGIGPWSAGIGPWSAVAFAPLLVCAANLGYGLWAIDHWTTVAAAAPPLRAAVVQVNSALDDATPLLQEQTRTICAAAGADDPFDIVIWPECSGGSYDAALDCLADEKRVWALSREPDRGLRPLASPACPLLFGGKIFTGEPEKPRTLHQSAILIDCSERIVGRYHKRHLMPFGEYVPGSGWLRDIKFWFPLDDEFHEGSEATILRLPGQAALGVMLCYEDMVPAAARSLVRGGADVLVSLINGAAFTNPLTLRQHRLLAQLRAVECRRSFIRCAATGETCLIDPVGRITERLPLHVQDTLVVEAPRLESLTVYARTGPVFPQAAAVMLGIGLGWPWLRRRQAAGGNGRSQG